MGGYEIANNISSAVLSHAKFRGRRTAFVIVGRRVSWRDFEARVAKVANALIDAGLEKEPGDSGEVDRALELTLRVRDNPA